MTTIDNSNDYWSATIAAFAPLHLPEPELSAKLLQRPPFRFIHDIVISINKKYGTFGQVLPEEMLTCANIDSKEKKIEFLHLLIHSLESMLHMKVEVNPKKIVSGSEPEKTNVFLQCIASAASRSAESSHSANQENNDVNKNDDVENTTTTIEVNTSLSSPSQKEHANIVSPRSTKTNSMEQITSVDVSNNNNTPNEKKERKSKSSSKHNKTEKIDTTKRNEIFTEVKVFNDKIANYALNLNATEKRSISDEGKSIVNMWNDLQQTTIDTTPSQLSQEALEMAIKRQIDTIQQISKLGSENDKLVDELEELLLETFLHE